ncbi:MAG: hypothetical protein PHF51_01530 [Candidatus ainarchaeum sp.]|nr:hypothetical protein [Candidatus ainarchaeum sp.]
MDGVEKRKEELFGKLKGAASRLRHKIHEESFLRKVLEEKRKECGLNARELRKRRSRLEFRIATEATSLAKEREMMKAMKLLEAELVKASEFEKLERKLHLVLGDIRAAESEITQTRKDIEAAKEEIRKGRESVREKAREEREKEWQERKRAQLMARKAQRDEETRKEVAPYMGSVDDSGVDLGSIAVIKKKGQ